MTPRQSKMPAGPASSVPVMKKGGLRIVAVLAVRNEQRFIGSAIDHLVAQGVEIYVLDNGSDDDTVDIARERAGCRLVGLEHVPFDGVHRWRELLRRKEELFRTIGADWVMHVDADEHHVPPPGFATLADAFAAVDADGHGLIESAEFTFIPTVEEPDHDHPDFAHTLRTYYHFHPRPQHLVRSYKVGAAPIEIAWSGGHRPREAGGPGRSPMVFGMRHYLFLSAEHAALKYGMRRFDDLELADGWHSWRTTVASEVPLPPAQALRRDAGVAPLDRSDPWLHHWLDHRRDAVCTRAS